METENKLNDIIYFGVALKDFDELDFKYDALAGVRANYFNTNLKSQSGETIQVFEKAKYNYCYSMEQSKQLLWKVYKDNALVQATMYLPDNAYCVCFYNTLELITKKIYFDNNHQWVKTEFYNPSEGTACICSVAPNVINNFFALVKTVYNEKGCVSVPVYMVNKMPPKDSCEAVAYTDKGMMYFTQQIPDSMVTDVEKSTGFTIKPSDFNLTKNMNSTFDVSFAPYLTSENGVPFNKKSTSNTSAEIENSTEKTETIEKAETIENVDASDVKTPETILNNQPKEFTSLDEEEPDKTISSDNEEYKYFGSLDENGLRNGYGRTETPYGKTAYEGEYKGDMRNGFGSFYYKDGSVNYVGNWQDNRREGAGVGFRSYDGTMHVGKWHDNMPQNIGVRFDKSGNFDCLNNFTDGKKNGIGVRLEKGNVVISHWENDKLISEKTILTGDESNGNI